MPPRPAIRIVISTKPGGSVWGRVDEFIATYQLKFPKATSCLVVNDLSIEHSLEHLALANVVNGNLQQVTIQHDEVCVFSCFQRPDAIFLKKRVRAAQCVSMGRPTVLSPQS